MKKNILLLLIGILIFVLGALVLVQKPKPSTTSAITNFDEKGYITTVDTNSGNSDLKLVYEKPGSPALTVSLVFDDKSMCTSEGDTRSIICLALSRTFTSNTGDGQTEIKGERTGDTVVVRTLIFPKPRNQHFGYLRSVSKNGVNALVNVDEVEFLSGEAAIQAGIQDTKCTRQTIADCIPSMNNDFYIRNLDKITQTYNITPDTSILIFENLGSPVLRTVDLTTFLKEYKNPSQMMNNTPFMFILDGATITDLEAQYTP